MLIAQELDSLKFLGGKDEAALMQIARRTGICLGEDAIAEADRLAAEQIARALAKDAIERVRCELSKAIRHAKFLSKDLALTLAHDVDSVSCPFLEVTEVFSESDWQTLLLTITQNAHAAVARRSSMTEAIATSLAELGNSVVVETLLETPNTPIGFSVCDTLLGRFTSEIWVLDKMARREDLRTDIVVKLTTLVSEAAREKLAATYNLQDFTDPLVKNAEISAVLRTVKKGAAKDSISAAETLQKEGTLTPLLLLTALQNRQVGFLIAALSVMAGRSLEHVTSVQEHAKLGAVKELLDRAGVPGSMHADFWKEIEALRQEKKP